MAGFEQDGGENEERKHAEEDSGGWERESEMIEESPDEDKDEEKTVNIDDQESVETVKEGVDVS